MLDDAIAGDPQNIELWFSRAQIFVSLEDYDEAIASLEKAIELNPQSYEAQFFTGYYIIMKADALNQEADKEYTNAGEYEASRRRCSIYSQAVPYLEVARGLCRKIPIRAAAQTLCYRLRDEPGMMAEIQNTTSFTNRCNSNVGFQIKPGARRSGLFVFQPITLFKP